MALALTYGRSRCGENQVGLSFLHRFYFPSHLPQLCPAVGTSLGPCVWWCPQHGPWALPLGTPGVLPDAGLCGQAFVDACPSQGPASPAMFPSPSMPARPCLTRCLPAHLLPPAGRLLGYAAGRGPAPGKGSSAWRGVPWPVP